VKLGLVGGNSHIGTELCFIFRRFGIEPVPIVRNSMGATFLRHHDFQCRIADAADREAARKALADIDTVVVAAYDTGFSKEGRATNTKIVSNAISCSAEKSRIVYFSSIRALSRRLDKSTPRWFMAPAHDREKRHLESYLHRESRRSQKESFALRIGLAFGKNQPRTVNLIEMLSRAKRYTFGVSEDKASSVLHTVSLADAILLCASGKVSRGTYSLINNPPWTWGKVLKHYAPEGVSLVFAGDCHDKRVSPLYRRLPDSIFNSLKGNTGFKFTLKLILPGGLRRKYSRRFLLEDVESDISRLEGEAPLFVHGFEYEPVPGPFVPGMSETCTLLETRDVPEDIFGG